MSKLVAFSITVGLALIACWLQGCDKAHHDVNMQYNCISGKPCRDWNASGEILTRGVEQNENHDVKMRYTCADWDPVLKDCSSWSVTGLVVTNNAYSCFPEDALVMTRSGKKRMDQTRVGDELLGFNYATGTSEYVKVRAWLHRHSTAADSMVRLSTDVGDIVASSGHSLATASRSEEYSFAGDLKAGDTLVTPDGSVVVRNVSMVSSVGLYAPLTMSSNLFVATPNSKTMFLAHSFAHVRGPGYFHSAFHVLLSVVEFFVPRIHYIDDARATEYMHPVCQHLMTVFGGLLGTSFDRPKRVERHVKFFAPNAHVDARQLLEAGPEKEFSPSPAPARSLDSSPTPPPPPPARGGMLSTVTITPPFVFAGGSGGKHAKDEDISTPEEGEREV